MSAAMTLLVRLDLGLQRGRVVVIVVVAVVIVNVVMLSSSEDRIDEILRTFIRGGGAGKVAPWTRRWRRAILCIVPFRVYR